MVLQKITKHPIENWEVSIMELEQGENKEYKVTRRIPSLLVAETKFFSSMEEAKDQFETWLQ